MTEKRSRQRNYSDDEKMILLNLIEKYKPIVLNQKTDHATWKDKETAWQNIEKNFNAISSAGIYRSADHLKSYFYNLKKKTKKNAADQKLSLKKTGSGPPENIVEISDPVFDLTLSLLNEKTVFGMENKFDSDHAIIETNKENAKLVSNSSAIKDFIQESISTTQLQDILTELEGSQPKNSTSDEISSINTPTLNWKKTTPAHLQSQKCKKLCTGVPKDSSDNVKEWVKKRRPTTTEKNELIDLYRDIAVQKLAFYRTQNEELAKKRKRDEDDYKKRLERDEEEHTLKKQLLSLDIKLKSRQLGLE